MQPLFILIDGHAVAYRQYYALPASGFSVQGQPTNAVFGFTRVLMDVMYKDKPDYLAVSFDMGLSGREELYGEYKGTREKMPEDLASQLDLIMRVVEAFNIPLLKLEGYEADDIIGTVTQQALAQDVRVRIITGDRDLLQLLTDNVEVQLPVRGSDDRIFHIPDFIEKYSIQPHQLVDFKALMGDSSDNIPGVAGIGEKSATTLISEYQTLENIYDNIERVAKRFRKKLEAGRDMAFLSRQLAQIQHDVPVTLNLPDCVSHEYDLNDVLKLFEELQFRTLRDRLVKRATPTTTSMFADEEFEADTVDDDDDFADDDFAPPALASKLIQTVIVRDEDGLNALVNDLKQASGIAWDVETTSIDQMQAELVGIALSCADDVGYYVPVGHQAGRQLPLATVIEALRDPLTDPDIPMYAHNATYDLIVMRRYGIDVTPITFDTMIAEWLLDPLSKNLGLKNLVFARLKDDEGRPIYMTPITDLIGTGKKQITMDRVAVDQVAPYAAADAAMTYRLAGLLQSELESEGLTDLYQTLEMPLIPVLADMQQTGVILDVAYLAQMQQELEAQLKLLEADIRALADKPDLNVNSPKQLSEVLFEKLRLPSKGVRKTKTGRSTDAATLESLKNAHEIIPKLLEYRELAKLQGTYVEALPGLVNPKTGRVHTSYNQTGTSTGRLSSSNPNLQNIPIRTELGREVRRAFLAPQGMKLLAVDYSQVELRVLAHISRDETLVDAFRQDQDIHAATAAAVNNITVEDVTYDQRSFAKRVNFGLIYGMGAFRLARDSDLTRAEAESFIKIYFERMPKVQEYIENTKLEAQNPEGLQTLLGRRRTFPSLLPDSRSGRQIKQAEERAAINMPIQGTAADILKKAMIDLYNALNDGGFNAKMVLQVHDELVLQVPDDEVEQTRQLVVEVMESAYPLDPPLKANAQVGPNWRDMD